MQITLLGTGGADGIPGLFSQDRVSRYAREHGGKDVRSRSAALIDDCIKLDFGPDTSRQILDNKIDISLMRALLITHSDADHLSIEEIQYAMHPFNGNAFMDFAIYGNGTVISMLNNRFPDWPCEFRRTENFVPFQVMEYEITPIAANHAAPEEAHNFICTHNGRTLLYATDTGVWPEKTWEYLKSVVINLLVIECTEGKVTTPYNGHLDAHELIGVTSKLRLQGTLTPESRIFTTHHSHSGEATHAELEALLGPHQINVGYDGLKLDV